MNYLDILPFDILDYINTILIKLYQEDHKKKFNNVICELNDYWFWVLWNADIYITCNNCYNIIPMGERKTKMLRYLHAQETLKFMKPSGIIYINKLKKRLYYQNNKLAAVNNNDNPDNIAINQP